MITISRPCYDKYRRCPGWAGPGLRYTDSDRCDNGFLSLPDGPLNPWRCHRCATCGMIVLPYYVRWIDPAWLKVVLLRWWRGESRNDALFDVPLPRRIAHHLRWWP